MPLDYSSQITRTGASALMPEEVSREIIQAVPEQSAVLQLARRLPNMSSAQTRMPVLDGLITAGWVSGDTGLKQTSMISWDNVFLTAEELAVIVPIPENVLDDADYDIWGEVRPRVEEAFGVAVDQAVLFGQNAPASFPDDILTGATAASQVIDYSTRVGAGDDVYDIVLGENGLVSLVEEDGYMNTGFVAQIQMRGRLRGLRDTTGQPIFLPSMQQKGNYQLDGEEILFPRSGMMLASALMFAGDWSQLVYSIRQDMTFKILDQAVLQGPDGSIMFNLAQQDMVALRCVMRLGWALPNPINPLNLNDTTRYPFSVLVP